MGSTRRPALALARPQAPRFGLRLGRTHLVVLGAVAVLGLSYLAARETGLFAVRTVEVRGAPGGVASAVRAALEPLLGESLVTIGEGEVERRVRALPSVRSATVDRDFPGTLRVTVRPERPVAVLRRAGEAWLVAASGTVLRRVERGELEALPRLWLPAGDGRLTPGTVLLDDQGAAGARALAVLPERFPARVRSVRGTPDELTLVLAGKTELRLGEAALLRLKLEVAATVLRSLSGVEREALAYLDVSLPTRPVGGAKPQVAA